VGEICLAKKRFVRISQDKLIRVVNYPMQYKVLTRRKLPDEQYWLDKAASGNRTRVSMGRGKQGSFPDWFKRGEIEASSVGYLE